MEPLTLADIVQALTLEVRPWPQTAWERARHERAALALWERYGEGRTLTEVGATLGVSKSRAGQIVQYGLGLIRHPSRRTPLNLDERLRVCPALYAAVFGQEVA